jgi:hypothetical protein
MLEWSGIVEHNEIHIIVVSSHGVYHASHRLNVSSLCCQNYKQPLTLRLAPQSLDGTPKKIVSTLKEGASKG